MKIICYCFGFSDEDILNDFFENGRSIILEKIINEKKAGGCNCSEKNPKGT